MVKKTENLKPIQKGELSKEEAKKRGQKGGIKSGEVRREKRKLKEILETFLEMDAPTQMKNKALEIMPELDNEHLSLKASLVVTLIEKISKGDMKAFELMRDTIGEKPVEKQEITGKDGAPLTEKIVYITPEEQKEVKEHIEKTING